MKLSDQFFHSFFYPFLAGVILSFLAIAIFSVIFTNQYIDKQTGDNIIEIEKKFAKVNLNSMNIIITSSITKIQQSINELISSYIKAANIVKNNKNIAISLTNNNFFKGLLSLTNSSLEQNKHLMEFIAYWVIDEFTDETNIKANSTEEKQLYSFSSIIQNIYSTFTSSNYSSICYYFYFDSSELFISYPLIYDYKSNFLEVMRNYEEDNQKWCTDKNGNVYKTYKAKCRDYYVNIQKAKSSSFDYNSKDNNNRTIFVTDFYQDLGQPKSANIYTMCIQFTDPISEQNAYACADIAQDSIISNLEAINTKLSGYFFVTLVGFNHAFYYPQMVEEALTPSEAIFSWNRNFFVEEKDYFLNHVQKLLTSNYIKYINDSLWDEVYINGENKDEQYFYFNGEKNYFSLYPITLENLSGKKEHVLSIIYVYTTNNYYERATFNNGNNIVKIICQLVIFIVFGTGLLYLIVLSFDILAKYIVIPIKNCNYMLKGINVGGINRLEYINFLKNKQDENADLLEKNNIINEKDNEASSNNLNKDIDNNNNNIKEENKLDEANNELISNDKNTLEVKDDNDFNQKINFNKKKYEEESEYIEKEMNFYNFNENLLQYRPLEIEHLIKTLIDLKQAILLTSIDQGEDKIISYSNSSGIFNNLKNKEAMTLCQSNIGNLQIQLHKYDKSIHHLALSLQDNKLKKFLSKNLSDEFDDSDVLLNKLYNLFDHKRSDKKVKKNKLILKQENNTKNDFSQKIIGNLINSRYNRLIQSFFKFFSLMQKSNINAIKGQYMNTSFHSIDYYNKILIQYIFLSYVKNDLIKIGESILDYIEFLLKFKFKTTEENNYILNIYNYRNLKKDKNPKRIFKMNIFQKIIKWFCLFDEYVSHIRNNSSLGDNTSILDDLSNKDISNMEIDTSSQSVFLFKINVQKGEFLKGKFALYCKNYNDALFYFIRAAKKESIVIDGLIKKKALKHIYKITDILLKKFKAYGIIKMNMEEKIFEYEKMKYKYNIDKKFPKKNNETNVITFENKLKTIKNNLIEDIDKCNLKKAKDVIIIIDFNTYNSNDENIEQNNFNKIDSFIEQTKIILDEYLSNNDEIGIFIYKEQYHIICPFITKNKIDIISFSNDLIYQKNKIFHIYETENSEKDENNDGSIYDLNNFSSKGSEENSIKGVENNKSNNFTIIKDLINTINYTQTYLNIKQSDQNEKYIILFTDLFDTYSITNENIEKIFDMINENDEIIFLLVGKKSNFENNEDKILKEIISNKFNEKSEIIYYENMKKIKIILSNNIEIKDEIIYPNEIYKY